MTEKLKSLLRHTDAEVRIQALKDVKKHGKNLSNVISVLIKGLGDKEWRIRKTAVEMLIDIRGKKVIKELINTLYLEDDANARNSAIEALIALGSEATEPLINAFKGSNDDVKKFIIDILGTSENLKVLPLLMKALEYKDENIRTAAVEHLGNIRGNVAVINALTGVLRDESVWVAYSAAVALGRIGDAKAVSALVSVLPQKTLREPVIRALGQIADAGSLSSIVPFLQDKSKTIREETLSAIEQFFRKGVPNGIIVKSLKSVLGSKAPNFLLPYTRSNKKRVKVAAVLLLGLLKDKKSIGPLFEMSLEEDLHEIVVKALVFIGKSMPELLIPFFNVNDSYKRRVLCDVAGKMGAGDFFEYLVDRLKDEDGHVRGNAAIALSKLNDPRAIKYIKPLLLDEYENIQEEAIKSLSKFKKRINLSEIIKWLSDKNPVLKKNSALLLGLLKEQGSVKALGVALKDSNISVRKAVVEALGDIEGKSVLKFLLQALMDESPEIRLIAAIAIGRMCSEESIEHLMILLCDSDIRVRAAAAKGLGNTGNKKAIDPLIRLLSDDSGFVRVVAIEALGNFKVEKVKNILIELLNEKDAEIKSTAVGSLAVFDGVAQDIIPLLKDKQWSVRKKAVDVLGVFFKDESYAYLKEVANTDEDSHVRDTAERYLSV
ncbi:MAG: HEAT repeat domain-containing protein [Thermodesulfovibrionia bacterium]